MSGAKQGTSELFPVIGDRIAVSKLLESLKVSSTHAETGHSNVRHNISAVLIALCMVVGNCGWFTVNLIALSQAKICYHLLVYLHVVHFTLLIDIATRVSLCPLLISRRGTVITNLYFDTLLF